MVRTVEAVMYADLFKPMVQRGLMQMEYDSADELVEAYLRAEQTVRDRAMYPTLGEDDRERIRANLLDRLAL